MEVEAVKGVTKKKETQGNGRLKCKEDEVKLKVTWDPRTSRSPSEEPARSSGEGLSLQDRRRQLLEQQRKKRQQQEKVMGVPTQVRRSVHMYGVYQLSWLPSSLGE